MAEAEASRAVESSAGPTLESLLLAGELERPELVALEIDARDEMYLFALELYGGDRAAARAGYFATGLQILGEIRQIVDWRFGGFGGVGALLDFASGFGRVTRLLAATMPRERLWAAEIIEPALAFLQRRLGVQTVASTARPEELELGRQFDLIFVSSLFSHLPEEAFKGWLSKLAGLLSAPGVLAFSVHDESLAPSTAEPSPAGLAFVAASESRSLDPEQYGSSWVSEAFVRSALAAIDPGLQCRRLPRGHCGYQDLYLVARAGTAPLAELDFDAGPHGVIEGCTVGESGEVVVTGWSVEADERAAPAAMEAKIVGGPSVRVAEFSPHPHRAAARGEKSAPPCAWRLTLPASAGRDSFGAELLVQAVGRRGRRTTLWAGTVAGARLAAARLHLVQLQNQNEVLQAQLASSYSENARREAIIQAMRASRFWRLRNAWFALKRALGLTEEA